LVILSIGLLMIPLGVGGCALWRHAWLDQFVCDVDRACVHGDKSTVCAIILLDVQARAE
jgi:hypothetical protein